MKEKIILTPLDKIPLHRDIGIRGKRRIDNLTSFQKRYSMQNASF